MPTPKAYEDPRQLELFSDAAQDALKRKVTRWTRTGGNHWVIADTSDPQSLFVDTERETTEWVYTTQFLNGFQVNMAATLYSPNDIYESVRDAGYPGGVEEVEWSGPDGTRWRVGAREDFPTQDLLVRLECRTAHEKASVIAILSREFLATVYSQWREVVIGIEFFRRIHDYVAACGWSIDRAVGSGAFLRLVQQAFFWVASEQGLEVDAERVLWEEGTQQFVRWALSAGAVDNAR